MRDSSILVAKTANGVEWSFVFGVCDLVDAAKTCALGPGLVPRSLLLLLKPGRRWSYLHSGLHQFAAELVPGVPSRHYHPPVGVPARITSHAHPYTLATHTLNTTRANM